MARRVFHAVVLLQVQVKVSSPRPQLYSNRCGARCMHWRLKQQGIKCMTANGSRLRRIVRAAPSSSQLPLAGSSSRPSVLASLPRLGPLPKQGPAISISSRAQLCLARSVICLLLPPHSETSVRLFPSCIHDEPSLQSRGSCGLS
jgi:hypothetical protein